MVEQEIRVPTDDGEITTFVVHSDAEGPFPVAMGYMDAAGYREQLKANAGYAMADLPIYHEAACERHFDQTLGLWRRNLAAEPVGAA